MKYTNVMPMATTPKSRGVSSLATTTLPAKLIRRIASPRLATIETPADARLFSSSSGSSPCSWKFEPDI
jgi:hypothetical protein